MEGVRALGRPPGSAGFAGGIGFSGGTLLPARLGRVPRRDAEGCSATLVDSLQLTEPTMSRSRIVRVGSLLVLGGVWWGPISAPAATLMVPGEYPTINNALDASAFGDTVLVAPGTYTDVEVRSTPWGGGGTTSTSMAFLKDGVVLKSEAGSAATILDMSAVTEVVGGPRLMVGVALASGETVVEGFTLIAGDHYQSLGIRLDPFTGDFTVKDCVIDGFDARPFSSSAIAHDGTGATIYIHDSVIRNCRGGTGAGIAFVNHDLVATDSRFEGNIADTACGAISVSSTTNFPLLYSVTLERCVFIGNRAGPGPGAVGHGSRSGYHTFDIQDCVFIDNEADVGGAIKIGQGDLATTLISGCLFLDNRSVASTGNAGAVQVSFGSARVEGCTFVRNTAVDTGSSISLLRNLVSVRNNVFAESDGGAAVFVFMTDGVTSACNVFWSNVPTNVSGFSLSSTDREVDPQFCDSEGEVFTVSPSSPCVEPGALGCGQIGAYGEGCGVISVTPQTWANIKSLYREGGAK